MQPLESPRRRIYKTAKQNNYKNDDYLLDQVIPSQSSQKKSVISYCKSGPNTDRNLKTFFTEQISTSGIEDFNRTTTSMKIMNILKRTNKDKFLNQIDRRSLLPQNINLIKQSQQIENLLNKRQFIKKVPCHDIYTKIVNVNDKKKPSIMIKYRADDYFEKSINQSKYKFFSKFHNYQEAAKEVKIIKNRSNSQSKQDSSSELDTVQIPGDQPKISTFNKIQKDKNVPILIPQMVPIQRRASVMIRRKTSYFFDLRNNFIQFIQNDPVMKEQVTKKLKVIQDKFISDILKQLQICLYSKVSDQEEQIELKLSLKCVSRLKDFFQNQLEQLSIQPDQIKNYNQRFDFIFKNQQNQKSLIQQIGGIKQVNVICMKLIDRYFEQIGHQTIDDSQFKKLSDMVNRTFLALLKNEFQYLKMYLNIYECNLGKITNLHFFAIKKLIYDVLKENQTPYDLQLKILANYEKIRYLIFEDSSLYFVKQQLKIQILKHKSLTSYFLDPSDKKLDLFADIIFSTFFQFNNFQDLVIFTHKNFKMNCNNTFFEALTFLLLSVTNYPQESLQRYELLVKIQMLQMMLDNEYNITWLISDSNQICEKIRQKILEDYYSIQNKNKLLYENDGLLNMNLIQLIIDLGTSSLEYTYSVYDTVAGLEYFQINENQLDIQVSYLKQILDQNMKFKFNDKQNYMQLVKMLILA